MTAAKQSSKLSALNFATASGHKADKQSAEAEACAGLIADSCLIHDANTAMATGARGVRCKMGTSHVLAARSLAVCGSMRTSRSRIQ